MRFLDSTVLASLICFICSRLFRKLYAPVTIRTTKNTIGTVIRNILLRKLKEGFFIRPVRYCDNKCLLS